MLPRLPYFPDLTALESQLIGLLPADSKLIIVYQGTKVDDKEPIF